MARRWTEREDATLARLYRAGAPVQAIARMLGRTADAVNARRRDLGIPARRRAPRWSWCEDALVEAATRAGVPAPILAERLGRPVGQVRWRRRTLGVGAPASRLYGVDEDDALRGALENGEDLEELARRLGRTTGALRLRAVRLGLHRSAPRRRWSPSEDAAIRDGYDSGLRCAEIARDLSDRTAAAVAARAAKLGCATHARRWTRADEDRLRRLGPTFRLDGLARLLGRTPEALRQRARRLGVWLREGGEAVRSGARWTAEEQDVLYLHPGLNPATLAEMLGRSDRAVTIRLSKLGLRAGRQRSPHRRTPPPVRLVPDDQPASSPALRHGIVDAGSVDVPAPPIGGAGSA